MANKDQVVQRLVKQLDLAQKARQDIRSDTTTSKRRESLRRWQAERLADTHADLLTNPRFGEAAAFFLSDIYGARDLSKYVENVRKLLPMMARTLPTAGLETIADAIELHVLTEQLDAAMVRELGAEVESLAPAGYASAYRKVGRRGDRERQIELIEHLGRCLDELTRSRLIGTALTVMRRPAQAASLGELQLFLERGYQVFRKMKGADEFLLTIVERERAVMEALLGGGEFPG